MTAVDTPVEETGAREGNPPKNMTNRLGPRFLNYLRSWFGLPWQRRLGWAALQVPRIRYYEKELSKLSDTDLRSMASRLRGRARGGESLDKILPEAFAMVCIAAHRTIGLRPFDVQLTAGGVLHQGGLAELATGEGKTLCASLPVFLNSLMGKGVHVTTVNDYLARRDAEWIGPVYEHLGLTVGTLQQDLGEQDRAAAYRKDITYGTSAEFGFDFLRDRLKKAGQRGKEAPFWGPWMKGRASANLDPYVQRDVHHFALVDEADNVFIDEARTPLIIASPTRLATEQEQVIYHWANRIVPQMEPDRHFVFTPKKQKLELTELGRQLIRWSNPPSGVTGSAMDKLVEHVEQALQAHHRFRLDQHYMVEDGEIVIIDEFTGRRMPDRHWRDGLHQAIEAKEGVQIHKQSDHAAQITFQAYFKLYTKLAGMTGTAAQSWWELRRVYKLWVVCVPTNRPIQRKMLPDLVFPTEDAKFDAIVKDVQRLHAQGRAVLIGTRSVEKSEKLSKKLQDVQITHQVLNARQHDKEAEIVKDAGLTGKVTIATNMAGRGTDIKPSQEVIDAGGLHVLGTERHEARRIDRQLEGRAGRQGDPGSSQFYLSLDDELLEGLGESKQESLAELGRSGSARNWQSYHGLFLKAQYKIERRHYLSRVDLMIYEKHRQERLKDLGADPYVD